MVKKAVNVDVEVLKETEDKLIVRANKPLKKDEFNLLSQLVKSQEIESGLKIVVLPHSAELEENLIQAEVDRRVKEKLELLEVEEKAKKEQEEKLQKESEAKAKKAAAEKAKTEKEKEADK